ncbi:hypothetical protein DVH24_029995 [Malus domestica]|uniref:Rx N-terminal domain-containing protein n=1 Tax=Malus domestica TaxID=3750 RepID=A0A498HYQ0_MALDO|nr:hypothetical protein DVH24_029995 [Malus domestica]
MAFEMLFDAVKLAHEENKMFQHLSRDIMSTLDSVQPLIKDFEKMAFLNLEEMYIDYCSDLIELPAEICELSKLKKFSVTVISCLPYLKGLESRKI